MRPPYSLRTPSWLGIRVALLLISAMLMAAAPSKHGIRDQTIKQVVEFFPAIEEGEIEVRLIPKNANLCRLVVQNHTDKPLSIQLPEAFGGIPVLAQQASRGAVGNRGSTQALGMAPPGTLFSGGSASASFNVPPEATGRLVLRSVCLERDKAGPSPRIPYRVVPLRQITTKPEVLELCRVLSHSDVNLRPVQAAVWHVNNNLSWLRLLHPGAMGPVPDSARFTQAELAFAQRLLAIAQQAAAARVGRTGCVSSITP